VRPLTRRRAEHCVHLKTLLLASNRLVALPDLSALLRLEHLDLSSNRIVSADCRCRRRPRSR
jgi:Leucine-rich repeat (LRR) protein